MIKKPDVLSDEEIWKATNISIANCGSFRRASLELYRAAVQAQLDVCVKHYEPLIKEMYEAVKFFIADHLTEYEYLDKGISSATKRGKKLLAFREALAKAEGK